MKLINKVTRSFFIASLIASITGGVLCYVVFEEILKSEDIERLQNQKTKFIAFVKKNKKLPEAEIDLLFLDRFLVRPIKKTIPTELKDTVFQLKDPIICFKKFKQISFSVKTKEGYYQVKIKKGSLELNNLIIAMQVAFGVLILLFIGILFFGNYYFSRKIWKPFYQTLDVLQTFKATQKESFVFMKSDVLEFQTLQKNLFSLTEQVKRDYQNLKSFTENASHELQTPLAVIASNLELLLQDNNFTEAQMQRINNLIESLGKLSKLNQTLLLLTKIENRQFETIKNLNLSEAIVEKIKLFDVWIQHKNLTLKNQVCPDISIQINDYLLDVLLNNLLGNAIKHNLTSGKLYVELNEHKLIIKNTGNPTKIPTEQLFERFQKDNSASDSMGLGLALVRQICDTYEFKVSYVYENQWHILTIFF